ncbi:MAG: glycosyltransferase family 4 protein [Patescibacteria group bacterium]|nr:glycosyltransferase family 4 protein [Patescibacteria group bacterium]
MNIGIDGNEANVEDRVGVNKYAFEMLWGLKKENEKNKKPNSLIVYLKNKPLFDLPKESNYFKYKVINGQGVWIITKFTPYLLKNPEKIDVLFSPSHYIPPFLTIPRICSVMDLGYLENTTQFEKKVLWQLVTWTAISVFASKQVLTISEASKSDIVRHYPFASNKVTVTHLGYDKDKFNLRVSNNLVRQLKNKYSIVEDYILFLSTLKPSKNIEGLLDAYSSLNTKKVFKNLPQLVIAGKKGWMFDDIYKKVKDLNLTDKVIFTDFIKEEEKPTLIAGSKLFILPSFWEGFGLDILSAFGCGVPVIASNVGSLPEVTGKAAVLIDPNNIESIANAIEKVLKMNKEEYNSLINLGFEQANKFSWESCSKKTLEVIENAIRQKR